jgi:hypothetical protein
MTLHPSFEAKDSKIEEKILDTFLEKPIIAADVFRGVFVTALGAPTIGL